MHNEWQIEVKGVEYVSETESKGCKGCAFDEDNYLCDLAVEQLGCSSKRIIWIKKEQLEDTSDRTHPDSGSLFQNQLPGTKYDNEKLQYSLIPPYALEAVARNLTVGLRKYRERDNWKKVPNAEQRYLDALMRHLEAVRKGEVYDPESSEEDMLHMAAVAANALFLLEFMLNPELQKPKEEKT